MSEVQGQEASNTPAGAGEQQQQGQNAQGQQGAVQGGNQAIDWNTVDVNNLPESVVKQHPAFKKVLSESVERRQQIKTLREQIEALDGSEKQTPTTPVQQPVNAGDEMPSWARDIQAQFAELKQNNAAGLRRDMVVNAIKKHNLPDEAIKYIQGNTPEEIEASAAGLVPLMVNAAGSSGNPGGGGNPLADTTRAKMWEKIKGNANPIAATSPLDPGVQRAKGGGGFFVSKGSKE